MILTIKEKEFEYFSDYPDGWQFSAGDPFKFPVVIGGYPCFIKRFAKKSPENIPGWKLLQSLKGHHEAGLIYLYDIVNETEKGKEVYYLFFEYVVGATLEELTHKGKKVDLQKLTNDLFDGISSLEKYGFWFCDFCEKNIFKNKKDDFVLIDLDSTYPVEEFPSVEMDGRKDYWICVTNFYKEILPEIKIQGLLRSIRINGTSFNYLQTAFLILHLKLRDESKGDFDKAELYDKLPNELNGIAPQIKEFFVKAYDHQKNTFSGSEILEIKSIISKDILSSLRHKQTHTSAIVLEEFKASKTKVKKNETFALNWKVQNADKLVLFKNGQQFVQLSNNQQAIEINETADKKNSSTYKIVATNNFQEKKETETIEVRVKGSNLLFKILLFAIVILWILWSLLSRGNRSDIPGIRQNRDTVSSHPDTAAIHYINLINEASKASWLAGITGKDGMSMSDTSRIEWPETSESPLGAASTKNSYLEDGTYYPVLQLHPKLASEGTIRGFFPWHKMRGKKVFKTKLGFIRKYKGVGFVAFQVWVHFLVDGIDRWENVTALTKTYDNKLTSIVTEIPHDIPDYFSIELRVNAGKYEFYNWIGLINPEVIEAK